MTPELGRALRAVAALVRDPENTAEVFAFIEALTGVRTPARIARRLGRTPLLRARPQIVPLLADRERLQRLPPGSLGRAYLELVEPAGLDPDGLRAASSRGERRGATGDTDVEYVRARLRDTHDLWHVVLGYGTDLLGEVALLAFTFAQTRNAAVGALVAVGLVKLPLSASRRLILRAFVRGLTAEWLPAQEWEALLPLPVDALRRRLRVGPPPVYTPVPASELGGC